MFSALNDQRLPSALVFMARLLAMTPWLNRVAGRPQQHQRPPRTPERQRAPQPNLAKRLPHWMCNGKTHVRPWMKCC